MKKRLDTVVLERFPQHSRTFIQSLIMQGKVRVDGTVVTKAGIQIGDDAEIVLDDTEKKYVSRAGYKLEGAVEYFKIDLHNLTVMDAGLSTGGFTDYLLQQGVRKVYGVDVGYGQVHEKIRRDPRVVVMERVNLRHLEQLPERVDMVTLDLSFISVLKVMDAVVRMLKPGGKLIVLIKPQFEAERQHIGKGGIVTNPGVHHAVVRNVTIGIEEYGFALIGVMDSPIEGSEGNKEFLAYFVGRGS